MNLLIGCPISHREWIVKQYIDYAIISARNAGFEPTFLFIPGQDDELTIKAIAEIGCDAAIHDISDDRLVDKRDWGYDRWHKMVYLRNQLLSKVRELRPKFFLSLDSDILLHPDALNAMFQLTEDYDAIGGKTYLTSGGVQHPSYAMLTKAGGLKRSDSSNILKVDVIMAIKLMNRAAYHVDYMFDSQGEDIGWSRNCKKAGLLLGWDGRVASKHCMSPGQLDKFDKRVGF